MNNILLRIIEKKREDLQTHINTFLRPIEGEVKIIAEIKLASPTVSYLGSEKDIVKRAIAYEGAGASALSVITEKYFFKGKIDFIPLLKQKVSLPILQKDFVIDPYQIYEAKIYGSSAILLIARLVSKKRLKQFVTLAKKIGIEPVVEINSERDLQKTLSTDTAYIAVNARDLTTFIVDIDRACRLMKKIPATFIKLGFSGIHSVSEVKKYKNAGAQIVLVGTSLMKAKNIKEYIHKLKKI